MGEARPDWEDDDWMEAVTTHFDPPVAERKIEVAGPGVIFETEEDRTRQRKIMAAICVACPWIRSVEMPLLHHFDFEAHDRESEFLFALMEMKRRFVAFQKYQNIWLSKSKADKCIAEAKERGCSFFFVVEFDNGIWQAQMYDFFNGPLQCPVEVRGRSGRVYQDGASVVEPCYLVDKKHFVRSLPCA
jgi:hypothetical protein